MDAGGRFSMTSGKHARSIMRLAQDMGLNTRRARPMGPVLVEGDRITVVAHLADAAASLVTRLESLERSAPGFVPGGQYSERAVVDRRNERPVRALWRAASRIHGLWPGFENSVRGRGRAGRDRCGAPRRPRNMV